jgi:hypothetical protein
MEKRHAYKLTDPPTDPTRQPDELRRPSQRSSWRRWYTVPPERYDDGHRANLVADDHWRRAGGANDGQSPAGSRVANRRQTTGERFQAN